MVEISALANGVDIIVRSLQDTQVQNILQHIGKVKYETIKITNRIDLARVYSHSHFHPSGDIYFDRDPALH